MFPDLVTRHNTLHNLLPCWQIQPCTPNRGRQTGIAVPFLLVAEIRLPALVDTALRRIFFIMNSQLLRLIMHFTSTLEYSQRICMGILTMAPLTLLPL